LTAAQPLRKVDAARWRREIVEHLADFPRQSAALESAMAGFGENFELAEFKHAYETETDMEAYNRAQAVERALARVQNYVADLSIAAVKLAQPEPAEAGDENVAQRAFSTLADAGVIDGALCRRLKRAQRARAVIEHSYVQVPARNVHGAAELVHKAARDFIGPYRTWIEEYL
jgi:uncharacterized protein YutE (UPF0331/DUF86 family)